MDFSQLNLDELIQKALVACNYSTPTPIQEKAIPVILQKQDVAASAETGSGKTAAFVLPALHHLQQQGPSKDSRVLILTPTRELAAQIAKATDQYGKFLKPKIKVVCLVGGLPYHDQIRALARGADIIVATPGRLLDHVRSKRVDLSHIEMLVLDEADRMLDMGFIEDIETVVDATPESRQTLLFSATLDKSINNVIKRLMNNPTHIDLSKQVATSENIKQLVYKAQNAHHKSTMLREFLNDENIFKAIIFSSTKVNTERLAQDLCDDGYKAASLHGDLRQRVRDRTVEQLRSGKIQFLVATDVAARGIDISDITHVFNYDLPRDGEDYVHRIGRTGRAGKLGTAISFVTSADFRILQRIERYIGKRLAFENGEQPFASTKSGGSTRRRDDKPRDRSAFNKDSRGGRSRDDDRGDRFVQRKSSSDRPAYRSDRDRSTDNSDRPKRSFRDRPADDRGERRSSDDRSSDRFVQRKSFSDRPAFRSDRDRSTDSSDRPRRSFRDKPADDRGERRSFDDRGGDRFVQRKSSNDRPAFRSDRDRSTDSSDRPRRSFRDKPADDRGERRSSDDRGGDRFAQRKSSGDRPAFRSDRDRSTDSSDRPRRSFRDRPTDGQRTDRKPFGDKTEFSSSDRPARKSFTGKPTSRDQGRSGKFSDDRTSRDQKKPRKSFGEGRFQHSGAPKTTTWRKKESA